MIVFVICVYMITSREIRIYVSMQRVYKTFCQQNWEENGLSVACLRIDWLMVNLRSCNFKSDNKPSETLSLSKWAVQAECELSYVKGQALYPIEVVKCVFGEIIRNIIQCHVEIIATETVSLDCLDY